jgi:hypothetical protein
LLAAFERRYPLRTIEIDHGDATRTRRLSIAAAMCDMSQAEFIRASIDIQIESMCRQDHWLRMMLASQTRKARRK